MKSETIKKIMKDPLILIGIINSKGYLKWISDQRYLKWRFKRGMGYKLDLSMPRTYNEKLQWLKLYDRKELYTKMVDKYEVRELIKKKIGEEYLIPLLGVWDNFDDIDFKKLPNEFVLKTTHDSGGVIICKDKSKLQTNKAKKIINKSLNKNYYYSGREWPYKNVKPKIICEKYMVDSKLGDIRDYKFFCFEGIPKIMFISGNRGKETKADFFDMDFNHLKLRRIYPNSDIKIQKPVTFDEMKRLSSILADDIPHVRVDFYEINGKVYFGELTFFTGSGFEPFYPNEYDTLLGDWIRLPTQNI